MELRHLRYSVVADTCHFGQAAERGDGPPPLSQQIRQLEAELGTELFARTTRTVRLAPAREAFLVDAQRLLHSIDGAARRVRRFADGKVGTLRIGLGTASYAQLPILARGRGRRRAGARMEPRRRVAAGRLIFSPASMTTTCFLTQATPEDVRENYIH